MVSVMLEMGRSGGGRMRVQGIRSKTARPKPIAATEIRGMVSVLLAASLFQPSKSERFMAEEAGTRGAAPARPTYWQRELQ